MIFTRVAWTRRERNRTCFMMSMKNEKVLLLTYRYLLMARWVFSMLYGYVEKRNSLVYAYRMIYATRRVAGRAVGACAWDEEEIRIPRNESETRLDNGKTCKVLNTCLSCICTEPRKQFLFLTAIWAQGVSVSSLDSNCDGSSTRTRQTHRQLRWSSIQLGREILPLVQVNDVDTFWRAWINGCLVQKSMCIAVKHSRRPTETQVHGDEHQTDDWHYSANE